MKAAGTRRHAPWAKLVSLAIIIAAATLGVYVLHRSSLMPTTDDGTIDADVVHIAAEVGGRIIDLPVTENLHIGKSDLIFQIDPVPYSLAVDQARANLAIAQAA